MSSEKRQPQSIALDVKRNKKIDTYFHQVLSHMMLCNVDKFQQNGSRLPQTSYTKCQTQKTNLQAQGCIDEVPIPTKTVKVTLKGDHRAYEVKGSGSVSLYQMLTSQSEAVKEKIDSQKGKEMLVRGIEGIEGFVNPGMPLSCFPENCHVEITFVHSRSKQNKENQVSDRLDQGPGKCVKFYIHAIGKERKRIVKLRQLHKKGCKLCIYAFKEETIKEALCKDDGRFLPLLKDLYWKLIENADTILESTQLVDNLEKRVFEVEFDKKPTRADTPEKATAENAMSANREQSEKKTITLLEEELMEQYPSLKSASQKIKENLRKNKKEANAFFKVSKTNFGKMINNSIKAADIKVLYPLLDSVGYIEWNNSRAKVSATCFIFSGLYIFTCQHVLNLIVGEGTEVCHWPYIISQFARVTFNYYNSTSKDNDCFSIDSSFLIFDATLDYAILKLQEDREVPLGLCHKIDSVPPSGLVYIIGHPDGEAKGTDFCFVIPQSQRQKEYQQRTQHDSQSVLMYTRNSFQKIVNNPDIITYDTSFYFGSSGSPIFDSNGALVAMHCAGLTCDFKKGTPSILEYGISMKSILRNIYQSEAGRSWLNEINLDGFAYVDWPVQDVEMVSVEED
ncbi:PREDICTED: LOW QUALITY PROTEIN: protein FAM111A [Condylura cristata]|uniref:LOW QUALITY PROTEIN: protein FAM111A n=1 Tax=Condylura cristata TaxID=143302 RepID=UPI0006437AA6|nr:PREDICTED: LOW QUALITY PROTEIN: protein FAM111A [Condylura cristata]